MYNDYYDSVESYEMLTKDNYSELTDYDNYGNSDENVEVVGNEVRVSYHSSWHSWKIGLKFKAETVNKLIFDSPKLEEATPGFYDGSDGHRKNPFQVILRNRLMSREYHGFKAASKEISGLLFVIFILFATNAASAQNFEVDGGGGILFYWKGEQISYRSGGFSYKNNRDFKTSLDILHINSDMSRISGEILKIGYSSKFDFESVRAEFYAGYIEQSEMDASLGTKKLKIGRAEGFYAGASLGFNVRKFEIKPSILFGGAKFEDGDFNFFYGKPDIPKIMHLGLSGEYDKKHKIGISFTDFDLNIYGNNDMPLFDFHGYVLGSNYTHTLYNDKKELKNFSAEIGIHSADMSMSGSLTPANQQYFLFPFEFYNLDGSLDAYIGHAIFDFEFRRTRLNHSLKIGAVHVFGGEINADYQFKYRKFFGTDEKNENIAPVKLKNTGFGFLAYSVKTPKLIITDKIHIGFELRKILAGPWGIGKFIKDDDGNDGGFFDEIDKKDLIKTILLSGLSGNLSIGF